MSPSVRALSLVDVIAADIRDKLFEGEIEVDTQLTEAQVAADYDVARPTAKAAIEKLVVEGLLLRGTHKTARVPSLGPDDVRDLYFTRLLLETGVVRRLAEQRRLPEGAREANDKVIAVGDSASIDTIGPVLRFHVALVSDLGSPRTDRLYSTLMGEMRLCMVQMQMRDLFEPAAIAREHEEIMKYIVAGDPEAAVAALTEHLKLAERRLVPMLEGDAEPKSGKLASR